jgi:hypothetical protein
MNAVFSPSELSIHDQSQEYLAEIISYLKDYSVPKTSGNLRSPSNLSIVAYNDFINLIRGWYEERIAQLQVNTREF